MSSPIERQTVLCPGCGKAHDTERRASMNLLLDDFSDEYVEAMSTTSCPHCGLKIQLNALVIHDDDWDFRQGLNPQK